MKAVFDTNILIDYLNGHEAARDEIARYGEPGISVITLFEVMVGVDEADEEPVRRFLDRFQCLPVTFSVGEQAARIRRDQGIRVPDALIWATALTGDALLVTRNTRDFPGDHPTVRVPYQLLP